LDLSPFGVLIVSFDRIKNSRTITISRSDGSASTSSAG